MLYITCVTYHLSLYFNKHAETCLKNSCTFYAMLIFIV